MRWGTLPQGYDLKVATYIDGFNLYHPLKDLAKHSPQLEHLKWQNPIALSRQFLSRNDSIEKIYFFSAYPHWKPESMQRHRDYVAILEDLGVNVVLGSFKTKRVHCDSCHAEIIKHEEKQTDVNIAMQIMRDCYEKICDCVQLISGDTDLTTPIKFAKNMGLKINIVLPPSRRSDELSTLADKKSNIKIKHLQRAFLGQSYTLKSGEILQCPYFVQPSS